MNIDPKDINLDDFDGILCLDENAINEAGLDSLIGTSGADIRATSVMVPQQDKGAYSKYLDYNDPKLYRSWTFGKQILNLLGSIGVGYGCEVADYGKYVSVRVSYSNSSSGKTSSKTFLIVFDPDGKQGNIFQSSNRYRTFAGTSQAVSYIKSSVSGLRDKTN